MALLTPLLDVQKLDLAVDALQKRRAELPEREAHAKCVSAIAAADAALVELQSKRAGLDELEHAVGDEVAVVAGRVKEVEETLYSGSIRAPKELSVLQEEIQHLKDKQGEIEDREMALLEEIESCEAEVGENRALRGRLEGDLAGILQAIAKAEAAIDGEIADVEGERDALADPMPDAILTEYRRLRQRERFAGRAVAPLAEGSCGGCRVRLPVLEYQRLKTEPDDALLICVQCGRLLVR